ncbi:MAG TPA: DUF6130 family protein [Stellaceae bacterium]|nr:DUF6130 family protein [Stellaceae bacterium]
MKKTGLLLAACTTAAAVALWSRSSTGADAEPGPQSTRAVRAASPYLAIENEPSPKLIVDPPLPAGLAVGVVWIQYRVENLRIVPVFGEAATKVSPRVGHLHVTVDDLPFWWADTSDSNTIDIAGLPAGQHKVRLELVDANHHLFPGQTQTVTFTVPVTLHHHE